MNKQTLEGSVCVYFLVSLLLSLEVSHQITVKRTENCHDSLDITDFSFTYLLLYTLLSTYLKRKREKISSLNLLTVVSVTILKKL